MGFHQSRMKNESSRKKGGGGQGLAEQEREESLRSVTGRDDESERKSVMRMGATNPILLNHG